MKILLGTNNQHKVNEIKKILEQEKLTNIELLTLNQALEHYDDVEENGLTLEKNAEIKAEYYHSISGLLCLADDTGLEIQVLDMSPGVKSARFAGEHGDDKANRVKVLDLMRNVPLEQRKARFRTVICLKNASTTHFIEGICNGQIATEEHGENGFGYDSIFVPDGFSSTFAEMSPSEKNELSHRGIAIRKLAEYLKTIS